MVIKQSFWGHVSLRACSVSYLQLLLKLTDFLDSVVVFILDWLTLLVKFELTQPKVDQ